MEREIRLTEIVSIRPEGEGYEVVLASRRKRFYFHCSKHVAVKLRAMLGRAIEGRDTADVLSIAKRKKKPGHD